MAIPGDKFNRVIGVGRRVASTADWNNIMVVGINTTFYGRNYVNGSYRWYNYTTTDWFLHHKTVPVANILQVYENYYYPQNNSVYHTVISIHSDRQYVTMNAYGVMSSLDISERDYTFYPSLNPSVLTDADLRATTIPWDFTKLRSPYGFRIEVINTKNGPRFWGIYEYYLDLYATLRGYLLIVYHKINATEPLRHYIPSQLLVPPFNVTTPTSDLARYSDAPLIAAIQAYGLGPPITTPGILTVPKPGVNYVNGYYENDADSYFSI
ncbi:MAG: hypothetical protein HQL07_03850 [Nitrospirae bacterium]|nr:hypothetical protein [Magnetococcales bacterium]HAT48854.1 hypothetical protein [Alphaproteobacteria bacterium]